MVEIRCRWCRTLVAKIETKQSRVEFVCPDRRCRRIQTLTIPPR
jgi:phage FluMu protein Com